MSERTRVRPIIERVLAESQYARNSDKSLMLKVWKAQGYEFPPELAQAFFEGKLATPETIRRTRQYFQEKGEYLSDKQVKEQREREQSNWRKDFGY